MSHERARRSAVIGFSELLKAANLPPAERDEYTQSINLAGNALLNLINDVLDLSKIEAEQMVIVSQPTEIEPLLREIMTVFQYKVQEKGLSLRLVVPPDLPVLEVDSQRLRQILLNLVGNAVKFTARGGILLTAAFTRREPERGIFRSAWPIPASASGRRRRSGFFCRSSSRMPRATAGCSTAPGSG